MQNIKPIDIVVMLQNETGVHDIVLDIITTPNLKKTGNIYKDRKITKQTRYTGKIGKSYNTEKVIQSVENQVQGTEETGYVIQPRAWGRLINPYLIEHKGNYYLQVFIEQASQSVYYLDEAMINESELAPFFQKKQEQDIKLKDIKLENIKKMIFKGEEYLIL